MTDEEYWALWHPASGLPSGRWRVMRVSDGPFPLEEECGPNGKRREFKTMKTAQRAADQLNIAARLKAHDKKKFHS